MLDGVESKTYIVAVAFFFLLFFFFLLPSLVFKTGFT